jgi:hypothetical protein
MTIKKYIPDKYFIIGVMIVLAGIVLASGLLPQVKLVQTIREYMGLQARVPTVSGSTATAAYA